MKKVLALILIALTLFSVTGCASVGSTVGSKAASIEFGNFKNVGNDPNNLIQSRLTPAFDENNIYYCDRTHSICSVDYNGQNKRVLFKPNKEKIEETITEKCNFNLYNGYLYYSEDNIPMKNGSTTVLRSNSAIRRLNTETLQIETILEEKLDFYSSYNMHFSNMLIVDHYLFYSLIKSSKSETDKNQIGVINLDTLETRVLYQKDKDPGLWDFFIAFTTYKDSVYAFIDPDNEVLKFDINEADKLFSDEQDVEFTSLYVTSNAIVGNNGLLLLGDAYDSEKSENVYAYVECLFDNYNEKEGHFKFSEENNKMMMSETAGVAQKIRTYNNQHYILNDNIFVIDQPNSNFYMIKNFDENTEIHLEKPDDIYMYCGGVYNNTYYGIYIDYSNESENDAQVLISVDSEGNVTSNTIS